MLSRVKRDAPSRKPVKPVASLCRRNSPKAKDPSSQRRVEKVRRELLESRIIDADFYRTAQDINLPCNSLPRCSWAYEHPIIRSIKSLRKKNEQPGSK
jgi:hypothetical protein